MSQEKIEQNFDSGETATDSLQENLNPEEILKDSSDETNSEEVDNLPIESIGSYGRIEPLVNENTENTEETDSER